jgi:hypothetical protein
MPEAMTAVQQDQKLARDLRNAALVGEICRQERIDTFVVGWMVQQLLARHKASIGDSTLRDHLDAVQKLFAGHFPDKGELFARGRGRRGYEILPPWWPAWQIAMQVLGRKLPTAWAAPLKRLTNTC